jgi:hypothetical protein
MAVIKSNPPIFMTSLASSSGIPRQIIFLLLACSKWNKCPSNSAPETWVATGEKKVLSKSTPNYAGYEPIEYLSITLTGLPLISIQVTETGNKMQSGASTTMMMIH